LLSNVANIGLGIVQGSGTGPTLHIVMKSNLHTMSQLTDMINNNNNNNNNNNKTDFYSAVVS